LSFIPYRPERLPEEEMMRRAREYYEELDRRRSVRFFSPDPVPRELIEIAIRTASTAPSGAHKQPWRFVVVFEELYEILPDGGKRKNYYPKESVGIACGFFIAALHHMGLATLTHTPSPMGFLSRVLDRPPNEKPFILCPVGYPTPDAEVPDIRRKSLDEVSVWLE